MSSWGVMNMAAAGQMGWGLIEESCWRKGPWTAEEDRLLIEYVRVHGEGRWNSVARLAGLKRNGKSCRLRWVNYLRPDLKRGQITPHEESVILELHARWGNRWSTIARSLPGRTDNEIKNYWRTHFKKKSKLSLSDNSDKSKNRLLKRKQFHQQQLHAQQQQQQQQQQQRREQFDVKKIMSLPDVSDKKVKPYQPQMRQPETILEAAPATTYTNPGDEQSFLFNLFNINNNGGGLTVSSSSEATTNDDVIWDGLWNLEDVHGGNNSFGLMTPTYNCASSKASMHNIVAPFC